jgi:hypothetical protein
MNEFTKKAFEKEGKKVVKEMYPFSSEVQQLQIVKILYKLIPEIYNGKARLP